MHAPVTPAFFVPEVPPERTEAEWYALLAGVAQVPIPPPAQRVYSITYTHNGETWTSTVGERSRGTRTREVGRGRARRSHTTALNDPAIVLAIFPGNPHVIVTDKDLVRQVYSDWANPFLMGEDSILRRVLFPT
jgi:hypothetical protein